tara:strand:+ start:988 stop:1236 length:249 start_codon:yes stop_codon:yes gene_type:complete
MVGGVNGITVANIVKLNKITIEKAAAAVVEREEFTWTQYAPSGSLSTFSETSYGPGNEESLVQYITSGVGFAGEIFSSGSFS